MAPRENTTAALEQGFRLGAWRVRPRACELVPLFPGRSAEHVEPRAMQVLLALAQASGSFLSKNQLLETVWASRPVTEDSLTRAIHSLRRALADNPRDPYYIETRHNTGYRLLVRVHPDRNGHAKWWVALALFVAFVSTTLGLVLYHDSASSNYEDNTVAVLPFLNLSEDPGRAYLSTALTDALILNLAQRRQLRVTSRTSVMPYADETVPANVIAERLGVGLLVEGSVLATDKRVRISVQLVDPRAGRHLWAHQYDRAFGDVLDLVQEISVAIARQVDGVIDDEQPGDVDLPADSLETYLRARYDLARGTADDTRKSLIGFESLIRAHPNFGQAWLGQAQALLDLYKRRQLDIDGLAPALEATHQAERLLVINSELHRCIGQILLFLDWNFSAAEQRYHQALELNPSDTVAHRRYAWLLVAQRRFSEAKAHTQQLRLLDPLYYESAEMAMLLLYSRQTGEAIREFERLDATIEVGAPVLRLMAVAYGEDGRETDTRKTLLRLLEASTPITASDRTLLATLSSADLYRQILRRGAYQSPLVAAGYHSLLGENDAALEFLERAFRNHESTFIYIGALPEFSQLHPEPRYQALLAKLDVLPVPAMEPGPQ